MGKGIMTEDNIEKYKKLTQREHILLRPDSYIGGIRSNNCNTWIYDNESSNTDNHKMKIKCISYNPGLHHLFEEILINARDHVCVDNTCNKIDINIIDNNRIKIKNNGKGVPIQIHPEHQVYIPELIFGHLLSSTNYDDS